VRANAIVFVVAATLCSGVQAKRTADEGAAANIETRGIHDEAMRILGSIKSTEYRHKTEIDESKGAYYCDCSGFVGYVLSRTVTNDGRKGPLANGKSRPLAMDYEKFFAAAPSKAGGDGRWQRIERITDARPGDVIAWRHEVPKPGNTGHVVFVDQSPVMEKDGLVRVTVIDSTTLPSADISKDKGKSGIGRRTMWFKVDKDGVPVGYVRGSRTSKAKMEAIAIGRALPTKANVSSVRRAA
jgi:hypothetical protein